MKKIPWVYLVLAFCSTLLPAKEPSRPTNFSGNWVLDFSLTRNPPAGLEDCSMVVAQDQQQLKVETLLIGDLQSSPNVPNAGGYPGGSSRGSSSGRVGRGGSMGVGMGRGGRGAPGGGMGMPGVGDAGPRMEAASPGKVAAYQLYPHRAVYKLDSTESNAQLGDPQQTDATSNAKWLKNGEMLKLSLTGNEDPDRKGRKIHIQDQWRLSQDGKSLMVDRSIKSPEGSGTVHMIFVRKGVGSPRVGVPTTQ